MTKKIISYGALSICLSFLIFLLIAWLPVLSLWVTLVIDAPSFSEAATLTVHLFSLALFDAGIQTFLLYVCIAALTGLNFALMYYFYTEKYLPFAKTALTSGAAGILLTTLGFGCASCGTFLVSLLLAALGNTSLAFSLDGAQFQIVGIGLQLLSTILLIRQIRTPLVCAIE